MRRISLIQGFASVQTSQSMRTFASPLATELDDALQSIGRRVEFEIAGNFLRLDDKDEVVYDVTK